jgi:hypothetical protein
MDNAVLTFAMQEMMAEMAAMRAELNELKARTNVVTAPPVQQTKSVVSITRRNTLKRLGLALVGGAVAATTLGAIPDVQARVIAHPQTHGLVNRAGMLVLLPGAATPTGTAPKLNSPPYPYYGLIASGVKDTALNMKNLPDANTGVYGFGNYGVYGATNGLGAGVWGAGEGDGTGVYGFGNTGFGVNGYSINETGVYGISNTAYGVVAQSTSNAPFRIVPGAQPPGPQGRQMGDMYVDNSGNLHVYNGTAWRTVNTTAG